MAGSSLYGDPDELDRIATQLEQRAEEVRSRGGELATKAEATRWKSTAAERCRETIRGDRSDLERAAKRLDEAAALLRRHAQEVRELLASIKRIEEAVVGWFNQAIDRFNRAVERFNAAVESAFQTMGEVLGAGGERPAPPEPPWGSWPYQPGSLPLPGDKEWLDIGEFMRRNGVLRWGS
jgi:chromosome segregation ATPase